MAPSERTLITVAPITTIVRGARFEASISKGLLPKRCVVNGDAVTTLAKDALDPHPIGVIHAEAMDEVAQAVRYALSL